MKLVAITGSIGCGKTTLAKIAKSLGFVVYDVDGWVRRIYHNKYFLKKLDELFPGSVKDNVADKKFLRKIVFSDKGKLEKLENLIYPYLNDFIKKIIIKNAKNDFIGFLDAALLFEKGWDKYCDIIVLADVDYDIQKKRVMKRDNISADDFDKINNIQLKNEYKKVLSDIVINTDKPINLLKLDMIALIEGLKNG